MDTPSKTLWPVVHVLWGAPLDEDDRREMAASINRSAGSTEGRRHSWGISPTDSQSLDAYAYTANNPINATDPSGHVWMSSCKYGREDCDTLKVGHAVSSAYAKPISSGQGGGGSWDTPPKADSQPQGRPDCGWNPFCAANNALGTTGDLGRDLGGGVGNAYSDTAAGLVNHPADFMRDTAGVRFSATIGLCADIGAGYGLFGWGGHVTIVGGCVAATTNGQLGLVEYHGASFGPGNTGGHAGADVNLLLSNGRDIGDQAGPFVGTGGAVSAGAAGADLNAAAGPNHCGTGITTNVTGGWSPGIGASMYGVGGSITNVGWQSKPSAPCGATPATYAYAAFGSTRKSTGSLANEVRFTGQRTDGRQRHCVDR